MDSNLQNAQYIQIHGARRYKKATCIRLSLDITHLYMLKMVI